MVAKLAAAMFVAVTAGAITVENVVSMFRYDVAAELLAVIVDSTKGVTWPEASG